MLIESPLNEAIPAAAETVVVPDSVPFPGFVPIAAVTPFVKLVARFSKESLTSATREIGAPAVVSCGWVVTVR